MFLGRQHPGHWPRQLHCFCWGRVSGQSEVTQNLETKTSEHNSDGTEHAVMWVWFLWSFFSSFPFSAAFLHLLSFHSTTSHSLFFCYSSIFTCLSPLTSL